MTGSQSIFAADVRRVESDRAAVTTSLAKDWQRTLGKLLTLAARANDVNRKVVALNVRFAGAGINSRLALVTADPPLSVADALWTAIMAVPEPKEGDRA